VIVISRNGILTTLLIAYSLYQTFNLVTRATKMYFERADTDPVTVAEQRFEPVRPQLLKSEKIGYITDIPEQQHDQWIEEYFLTQYSLSPTIVDNSVDCCSLIVANVHDPSSVQLLIRNGPLSLVHDYGRGVLLLSRQTQ
jgi:hypothetical protein